MNKLTFGLICFYIGYLCSILISAIAKEGYLIKDFFIVLGVCIFWSLLNILITEKFVKQNLDGKEKKK